MKALLDLGAQKFYLPVNIVQKYFCYKKMKPVEVDVLAQVFAIMQYTWSPSPKNGNSKFEWSFFIMDALDCTCIFGTEILNFSGTKVDFVVDFFGL